MMATFRSQLRRRNALFALGLVAIFIWTFASFWSPTPSTSSSHEEFWRDFHPLLTASAPSAKSPVRLRNAESVGFDPKNTDPLPDLLKLSPEDVSDLKLAHGNFLASIKQSPPSLHYQPHTRGLVSTAGGSYLPVLVMSLRMLRRTGSTLPMEVFLASWDEYEGYLCQIVLPSLNAQCIVLSEILDAVSDSKTKIEKYQYKVFAMLFSSFEEILFLDADAFPLQNPEILFTSDPFLSKGLITWPDFWRPTTSPLYYDISAPDLPPRDTTTTQQHQPPNPATIRQSTESGELLLSKRTHTLTLLLATYYNFYGPSHYYPLLSQGAAGEGDKETFLAAATTLHQPFYQVSEPIRAVGRGTPDGFAGSTMVQYDPIEDYLLTTKGEWRIKGDPAPAPRPFFVHVNFPKFNPATVFTEGPPNPVVDERGKYTRAWTSPDDVVAAFGGLETEKGYWTEILWTACALEGRITSWRGREDVCEKTSDYWDTIFGDGEGEDHGHG